MGRWRTGRRGKDDDWPYYDWKLSCLGADFRLSGRASMPCTVDVVWLVDCLASEGRMVGWLAGWLVVSWWLAVAAWGRWGSACTDRGDAASG